MNNAFDSFVSIFYLQTIAVSVRFEIMDKPLIGMYVTSRDTSY